MRRQWPFVDARVGVEDLARTLDSAQAMVRALDGTVLFCTTGLCRLYGWSADEMLGMSSHTILATEFPRPLEEIDAELLRSGQWTGELKHTKKDGATLWVASHWAVRYGKGGEPEIIIEVNNDITALKNAEEALWKQRQAFRALAENLPDGVDRLDRNLRHIYVNTPAAAIMDVTPEQVTGRTNREMRHPHAWGNACEEWCSRVFQTGAPLEIEQSFGTKAGTRYLNIRCIPEHSADGVITSVLVVSRDITEHKQIESALRQSELRERARARELQATMNAAPAAIFIASDQACRQISGNSMAYELLRIPYGSNIAELAPEIIAQVMRLAFTTSEGARNGQSAARLQDVEFTLVSEDGDSVSMFGSVVPLSNETGTATGAVGAFIDVTELRTSQRLLEDSRDRQRALSDRLLIAQDEERRRIAQDLHDDLCQKLALLAFEVRNLAMDPAVPAGDVQHRIEALHERIIRISAHIRSVAYQLHPSAVDDLGLVLALQALCDEFSHAHGTKVRFTARGNAAFVPQEIASCLYRVTQEALGNVAKHARTKRISVSLSIGEDDVRLSVKDSGVGFKLHRVMPGLGMLSMEERVARVKGRMSIASEPAKGTRLSVWVPFPSSVS